MLSGLRLFGMIALSLVHEADGTWRLPENELGEECPFPLEPIQLGGQPLGMSHCSYCGAMVLAGVPHPDYRDFNDDVPFG